MYLLLSLKSSSLSCVGVVLSLALSRHPSHPPLRLGSGFVIRFGFRLLSITILQSRLSISWIFSLCLSQGPFLALVPLSLRLGSGLVLISGFWFGVPRLPFLSMVIGVSRVLVPSSTIIFLLFFLHPLQCLSRTASPFHLTLSFFYPLAAYPFRPAHP